MTGAKDKWKEGLPEEVSFWEDWLEGRTKYAEDRAFRLSSNRPFPWWAKPLIRGNPRHIRILDVGAGPVSAMGNVWGDKQITVVPVDPLAEEYAALLKRFAVTPPTTTIRGIGEELVEQFGEESFDFAYACNCLDHSLDPVECYRQMMLVLKPGCSLVTFHEANEAEHQNYQGLHQWNFSVREKRLIVWNRHGDWDIVERCPHVDHYRIESDRGYIKFTLTRKS